MAISKGTKKHKKHTRKRKNNFIRKLGWIFHRMENVEANDYYIHGQWMLQRSLALRSTVRTFPRFLFQFFFLLLWTLNFIAGWFIFNFSLLLVFRARINNKSQRLRYDTQGNFNGSYYYRGCDKLQGILLNNFESIKRGLCQHKVRKTFKIQTMESNCISKTIALNITWVNFKKFGYYSSGIFACLPGNLIISHLILTNSCKFQIRSKCGIFTSWK